VRDADGNPVFALPGQEFGPDLDVHAAFPRAGLYRLVIWDRRGKRLGGWETLLRRRDPRDLWPRVR